MGPTRIKTLIIILVTGLTLGAPAFACQAAQFERTVFLPAMPDIVEGNDFAGLVVLRQKRKWGLFKPTENKQFRAEIVQSPTHPDLVGSLLDLPLLLGTSCGPWLNDKDQGFVRGSLFEMDGSSPRLSLDTHRNMDIWDKFGFGNDTKPEMGIRSEVWPERDPSPKQE